MNIKSIPFNPIWKSLIYMERYVNDGSPSGFTFSHSCSKEYSPRHGKNSFNVPIINSDKIITYSINHEYDINNAVRNGVPIHPDFSKKINLENFDWQLSKFENYPTASPRTLLTVDNSKLFYLKLHYDGVLCRVKRSLPYRKAIAEVEMSKYFKNLIDNNLINNFGILLSPFCNTYYDNKEENQFSAIIREFSPYPYINEKRYLIPFFSLFSKDSFNPDDESILFQLLKSCSSPEDIFYHKIIFPIIDIFVKIVMHEGLIPEINAQNLLLEINEELEIKRIIFRDLMGVEKDLSHRESLGLKNDFDSINYKSISIENPLYFTRHSFSYDFKLSQYIIEPLVANFADSFNKNPIEMNRHIQDKAKEIWGRFQFDFFNPIDKWYSHPKVLLVDKSKRTYLENNNPLYR